MAFRPEVPPRDRISVQQVILFSQRSYDRFWYVAESMISTTISTR